jgi:hypothetical protein
MFLRIVTFPQIILQKSYEVLGYVKQGVLLVWARGNSDYHPCSSPQKQQNTLSGPRCCSLLLKVGIVDHTEAAPTPAHQPLDACYYPVVDEPQLS